jgi:hypothetical protein
MSSEYVQIKTCEVVTVTEFDVEKNIITFDTTNFMMLKKLVDYTSTYFEIAKDDPTFADRVVGSRLAVYDDGEIEEIDDFDKFQKEWRTHESFMRLMKVQCMLNN